VGDDLKSRPDPSTTPGFTAPLLILQSAPFFYSCHALCVRASKSYTANHQYDQRFLGGVVPFGGARAREAEPLMEPEVLRPIERELNLEPA
jgi:hypothetical protein